MATRKTTAKPKTEETSEAITLEQALKEEGEGRTPESIRSEGKKPTGPSKMHQATKIMEELWEDIQAGKVKRKDVIQRFINEVSLTPKGAATYFGSIKAKLSKTA
jgi:hypothetical protein